jgi:hypothetical protein
MYRLVDTEIWDDAWYSDLAPEAKFLFLWFLTNRRTNSVGAYEITLRQVAFETGLKADMIDRLLTTLHPKVQWWPEHSIVWVKNFYGRQNNGEKIEINARRIVADLPSEIREAVGMAYPSLSLKEDTPSIPHAYPMHKQNSNVTELNVTETERDTPPTPQGDVRASAPDKEKVDRRKRIPEDWQPSEALAAYAMEWGIPADQVSAFAEEFKLYWLGDGRPKVNWDLAFQGRVRDQAHRYKARASPARNGRATAQDFLDLIHDTRGEKDANAPPGHAETVIDAAYSVSDGQTLGAGGQRHR